MNTLEDKIKIDEKTGLAYIESEDEIETCHVYLGINTPMHINLLDELGFKYDLSDIEILKDNIYNIKIISETTKNRTLLRKYCRCRLCKSLKGEK